jgi:hypothetical protein
MTRLLRGICWGRLVELYCIVLSACDMHVCNVCWTFVVGDLRLIGSFFLRLERLRNSAH